MILPKMDTTISSQDFLCMACGIPGIGGHGSWKKNAETMLDFGSFMLDPFGTWVCYGFFRHLALYHQKNAETFMSEEHEHHGTTLRF